tara:strand:- start:1150 stop:1410 length:261 start_codon:yes stop_codon:yes gene_type:complete
MTDSELIKNYILFHAYFCHLIENRQADTVDGLCNISLELEQEIIKRNISSSQIEKCIHKADLEPQDSIMVNKYIYAGLIDSRMAES